MAFLFDHVGLLLGAIALGAVHGIEPGHGWPVAASYALDQRHKWLYGLAASTILGVGHLISSIAMVAVFFLAKAHFNLTQINDPIILLPGIHIGGPMGLVAGMLLIILGVREYVHGHSHTHSGGGHEGDSHALGDDGHGGHSHGSLLSRLVARLPLVGGRPHTHGTFDEAADRGLLGLAVFAFLLGFAHEEEFEIIAICIGSDHCLELMSLYAITVIMGIIGFTMLLIAGYYHFEEQVERFTPYLPAFSAFVLIIMGVGFVLGLF